MSGLLRVAMLGAFPPQTQGVQEYCRGLAEALSAQCHVHAIGFRSMYPRWAFPGVKDAMDATKPPMRGEHLRVEHPLAWYDPLGWQRTAACIDADVFHLQWWSLPLFPVAATFVRAMRRRRVPIAITVHNVLPHEASMGFVAAGRWLCRRADRVFVHSAINREQLITRYGLPETKVIEMPMGAATAAALPERSEACHALGLDPARRYALAFGTIRPYKGIADLLESLARIAHQRPGVDLIIAGQPWTDWTPFEERIAEHGIAARVHRFLEYIPEARVPLFFAAADLVALPYTHFDAQSAVGALALPYGKPLLVSETGGLPDWVDHDPAWIVPPRDPTALADRLDQIFADPEAAAARFAPIAERVRARHAWDAVAAAHLEVYEAMRNERHSEQSEAN